MQAVATKAKKGGIKAQLKRAAGKAKRWAGKGQAALRPVPLPG